MAKPGRGSDQFPLRLPPGMRDQIKKAAEERGRSMNAEIVDRLEHSLSAFNQIAKLEMELRYAQLRERDLHAELSRAKANEAGYRQQQEIILELQKELQEKDQRATEHKTEKLSNEKGIYVALDANGFPISWSEITTHLSRIAKASGEDIQRIDARIFNAQLVPSDQRETEWLELHKHYQQLEANK